MAQLTDLIQQQTVAMEQLRDTMTGISSVMDGQLESLKSIARWQDQTALYTSHLQNIKVDINQIRKWSEPINRIADRIDVLADREDAERQEDLSGGDEDAIPLSGDLLQQIADNTLRTAVAVEQIQSVQAEPLEDKREDLEEKVSGTEQKKDKTKKEQGEMGKALGTVGTFFRDVIKGFVGLGVVFGSMLLAPPEFFRTVKEFFGKIKEMFKGLMTFFVNDVAPIISSVFREILEFFNDISPSLMQLGGSIADVIREVIPKLMTNLDPIFEWLKVGTIKIINMLNEGVTRLPEAIDNLTEFITKVIDKLFDYNDEFDTNMEAIEAFFRRMIDKFNEWTGGGGIVAGFEIAFMKIWNFAVDAINTLIGFIETATNIISTDEDILLNRIPSEMKFTAQNTDLSDNFQDMIDPTLPVEDQIEQARKLFMDEDIGGFIATNLINEAGESIDPRLRGLQFRVDTDSEEFPFLMEKTFEAMVKKIESGQILSDRIEAGERISGLLFASDQAPAIRPNDATKFPDYMEVGNANFIPGIDIPTILVTDNPPAGGLYTSYINPDTGQTVQIPAHLQHTVTAALQSMDKTGPDAQSAGGTQVTPTNTFGQGTGMSIARQSVDNRFVLDPGVHGSQQPKVNTFVSGAPVVTNMNSSQVQMSSGSTNRNPFYSKQ